MALHDAFLSVVPGVHHFLRELHHDATVLDHSLLVESGLHKLALVGCRTPVGLEAREKGSDANCRKPKF
jgi:hypothetical protein